jgi:hypothetical protein
MLMQIMREIIMSNQYKAVYKNTGTTPRSMNEAYKNADYATPIYQFKTEWQQAGEFFVNALVGFIMMGCLGAVVIGFLVWLGVV